MMRVLQHQAKAFGGVTDVVFGLKACITPTEGSYVGLSQVLP